MTRIALLLLLGLLLIACADDAAEPPPVEVVVAEAQRGPFLPEAIYVGQLEATNDVEIEARVSGYLRARHFREGDEVATGDLLYEIDPSEYKADLAQARAQLARQRAAVAVAERNHARGRELVPQGYIAASQMDELEAAMLEARAALEAAQAQVEAAEVALGYTRILAPIAGRVGRSAVSVGDLVGPNSGPLTTLVSLDPVYALFQVAEATALTVQRDSRDIVEVVRIALELADGQRYPHEGKIDFLANRVDAATGTIAVRAVIPNPDDLLRPGLYVRVHVLLPEREELLIPQAAVQSDQQGSYVLQHVEGRVERRNVTLGERTGTQVIVRDGLQPGDAVVVGGLQRIQPGQPVRALPLPPEAPPPVPEAVAPGSASPGEPPAAGPDAGRPLKQAAGQSGEGQAAEGRSAEGNAAEGSAADGQPPEAPPAGGQPPRDGG